jgi:hypothetical protein
MNNNECVGNHTKCHCPIQLLNGAARIVYTGANLNRPGIRQLIQLVKKGEIQVIVVYRRDRLFRDTGDSTDLQAYFDLHKYPSCYNTTVGLRSLRSINSCSEAGLC